MAGVLSKKKLFRWKPSDDEELLKLVLANKPTTTAAWEELAKTCSQRIAEPRGYLLTKRGCLDHYKLLINAHSTDSNKAKGR